MITCQLINIYLLCGLQSLLIFSEAYLSSRYLRFRRINISHKITLNSLTGSNSPDMREKLSFIRNNPLSDKFSCRGFHHVEFYCGDATTTFKRFIVALGMELCAKSDLSTGNLFHASYAMQSEDVKIIFTAPYPSTALNTSSGQDSIKTSSASLPGFNQTNAFKFIEKHGLAIKAVAIIVDDVLSAFETMKKEGGIPYLEPIIIKDVKNKGYAHMAEICLYGDVTLRLLNLDNFNGRLLPNFEDVYSPLPPSILSLAQRGKNNPCNGYGLAKFDHIVGNLWTLQPTVDKFKNMTVSLGEIY